MGKGSLYHSCIASHQPWSHLMHGCYSSSVEENSLCECCLSRVDVCRDADIPYLGCIQLQETSRMHVLSKRAISTQVGSMQLAHVFRTVEPPPSWLWGQSFRLVSTKNKNQPPPSYPIICISSPYLHTPCTDQNCLAIGSCADSFFTFLTKGQSTLNHVLGGAWL